MTKFYEPRDLNAKLEIYRAQGKSIGLSHGVFDLVHPGHIQHFIAAKKLVDVLVVSITSDEYVNKGPGRPVFNEKIRASTLSAFQDIDFVTISRNKTSEELISLVKPNIYFKGSDYKSVADDPTGKIEAETKIVEKFGGIIHFTDEITSSSSKLINQHLNNFTPNVKAWIEEFKNEHSMNEIDNYLLRIQELEVALVGEVILDQYTTVEALGKSSKDPILAFHLIDTNVFAGGILAIANNCANWVKKVSVFSTIGNSDQRPYQLASMLNPNIEFRYTTFSGPTITKHRYIDAGTKAKVFETYDFAPNFDHERESSKFLENLVEINKADITIVADYGHGLLNSHIIDFVTKNTKFLAVNTQANAGNRGYNTISKYPKIDFFTANSAELQLEMRSKLIDFSQVVPELMKKSSSKTSVLTMGASGLYVFSAGIMVSAPALAQRIVDKVGAGDSVFAISSLLSFVEAPPKIIGLISNLVAAHEVSQLGHQSSLSLGDIRKQLKSLLG